MNLSRPGANSSTSGWTNWKKFSSATSTWVPVVDENDGNSELAANRKIILDLPAGSHLTTTGEGATDLWYYVEVDSPPSFLISGSRWYRIRATGYVGLPGQVRANNDSPDGARSHNEILRKLDLKVDHFVKRYGDYANAAGTSVAVTPQAARRVEVTARPVTPFSRAIVAAAPTGNYTLTMPLIDSFDSTDTVNYPGGIYNSFSRNINTGVGTNATIFVNSPISNFYSTLYGNLETNGGSVAKTNNISGSVTNNVTLDIPPVTAPAWKVTASSPAPTIVTAGTIGSPLYASYSSINRITVVPPLGQTTGEANLYVTGDVRSGIAVMPGVTLKIWSEGNFSMKAREIDNLNLKAINLQLYGINPPPEQSRTFDVTSGTPTLTLYRQCPRS